MASKKWKKRLKKIGKVAAIAGAAALAAKLASKRGRAGEMSGLTTVPDSQKEGFTSRYITKKTIPDILPEAKVVSPAVTTGGSYLSRMGGAGNRATQIANQKKRAKKSTGGKSQGYNARLDESLGARKGKKSQSFKARRDESKGMEKASGKRAYSAVSTMDKG